MANLIAVIPINERRVNKDKDLMMNNMEEDKSHLISLNSKHKNREDSDVKTIPKEKVISFLQKIEKKKENRKKSQSKVGEIKEGYRHIYGINPIDRYNFIINRYNEEINAIKNVNLAKVPICKPVRRVYDLYTWICRVTLGAFLIITFYCYRYKYRKSNENKNRAGMLAYAQYLNNENKDYFNQSQYQTSKFDIYNPSFYMLILGCLFLLLSLYLMVIFFIFMIIPNLFFTLYLLFSLIIHKCNNSKVSSITENMLYESKLDDKGLLNDYIVVDHHNIKQYAEFSYYEKLLRLFEMRRNNEHPQSFMLYGDLFLREYGIIYRAVAKQLIGIVGFLGIGFVFYFN